MSDPKDLIRTHLRDCAECDDTPESAGVLARMLDGPPEVDVQRLSALTRSRLAPLLYAQRARVWRRHVAVGLVLAAIPLPFVLAMATLAAGWIYDIVAAVLPVSVATYAAGSYGAAVLLLIGLTYAAIPVLLAGRGSTADPALH